MDRLRKISNPSKKGCASRGFTLLEVIVAMTVMAVGIAGVLGALSACLRSTEMAENYTRGSIFAQQVASLLERNTTLSAGTQSGTFSDQSTGPDDSVDTATANPASGFTWTAVISPADSSGCYPTQITVNWDAARQQFQQQYQLSTILYPQPFPVSPPPQVPGTLTPTASREPASAMSNGANSPATPGGPGG